MTGITLYIYAFNGICERNHIPNNIIFITTCKNGHSAYTAAGGHRVQICCEKKTILSFFTRPTTSKHTLTAPRDPSVRRIYFSEVHNIHNISTHIYAYTHVGKGTTTITKSTIDGCRVPRVSRWSLEK